MAKYEGSYKGVTYRAFDTEEGKIIVRRIDGLTDEERQRVYDAKVELPDGINGEVHPNLTKAGHAIARAVLVAKGLPLKDPPARATFKVVDEEADVPAKPKRTRSAKAEANAKFVDETKRQRAASTAVEDKPKRARASRKPSNHGGLFSKVSPARQAAAEAEGKNAAFCRMCLASFTFEGPFPPDACPNGHTEAAWMEAIAGAPAADAVAAE